jgi:exopolyphosphatase/guanosine-5'-triphosphate,3'-diphosphate pyrophosphatase
MRVATIDIGTNTVLLLVADRHSDGSLVSVAERATITRLGEGVDRTRRFLPAAIARTMDCLREYAEVVRVLSVDRIGLVGTSAMRDADGGAVFSADVESLFGIAPQVISGEAEARLTFRGAVGRLSIPKGSGVAVFDIGGGSTEVVLGKIGEALPSVEYSASFDIGSVRLTERHVNHDPPTVEEHEALSRAVRDAFASVPAVQARQLVVGIAGTMTTLAAVSLGLVPYDGARVHGFTMRLDELERVVQQLAEIPLEARRLVPGMEPKRADVIIAGGLIALGLLRHWGVESFVVSDRGVRWGLAEELR